MIASLQAYLINLTSTLPVEVFVFLASALEELIPPIPAFPLMIFAGTLAKAQSYPILGILLLAIISAVAKTLSGLLVYRLTDLLEDAAIHKYGRWLNIKEGDLEALGKKFGNGLADYFVLISLRLLPFMPSSLVSVGAGLIALPYRLFIVSAFIGSFIRDGAYIYLGYFGLHVLKSSSLEEAKSKFVIAAALLCLLIGLYFYLKFHSRRKRRV